MAIKEGVKTTPAEERLKIHLGFINSFLDKQQTILLKEHERGCFREILWFVARGELSMYEAQDYLNQALMKMQETVFYFRKKLIFPEREKENFVSL